MGRGLSKFLFGIVIGILITVLGVGVGGYLLITSGGMMGKIEESGVGETLSLNFTDEQRAMSILQYGSALFGVLGNLTSSEIGELEDAIGSTLLSDKLSDAIGVEKDVIRTATIATIGQTVADNLTVNSIQEKFGIGFPENIPLFKDENFRNSPISTAFKDLDDFEMRKFIEVTYDEDATLSTPASSPFLQQMGRKKLSELSSNMDGIIRDITIGDVLDVDKMENPSTILRYLKDYKIGDLDKPVETDGTGTPIEGTGGAIQNMTVADVIENTDTSAVLQYLAPFKILELGKAREKDELNNEIIGTGGPLVEITIGDAIGAEQAESNKILKYLKDTTLDKLGEKINAMKVSDAVDITDAHAVVKKIADLSLSDLGSNAILQERINDLKLSEIITINDNSEPILLYFRDKGKDEYPDEPENWGVKLADLNSAIATMTVKDVFKDAEVGILSLVPSNTPIGDIATVLPGKVTSTSLYALMQVGVLDYSVSETHVPATDYLKKCNIHNADITRVVDSVGGNASAINVDIVPVGIIELTTAGAVSSGGYYVITPTVVRTLTSGKEGSIIRITENGVKLKIAAGPVEDNNYPVFSIQNAYSFGEILFEDGIKMVSDKGGYAHFCCPNITGTPSFTTKMVSKDRTTSPTSNVLIEVADYTPVSIP